MGYPSDQYNSENEVTRYCPSCGYPNVIQGRWWRGDLEYACTNCGVNLSGLPMIFTGISMKLNLIALVLIVGILVVYNSFW